MGQAMKVALVDSKPFTMTPDAREALAEEEIADAFHSHISGEGVVFDQWLHQLDFRQKFRVTSAHETKDGTQFLIVTDFDLSTTTLSLVEDE